MAWRRGSRPPSCTPRTCSGPDRTAASSPHSLRRRDSRRRSMEARGRMASRGGRRRRHRPRRRSSRFRSCRPFPSGRLTVWCPPRRSSRSARRGKSVSRGNPRHPGKRRSGGGMGRNEGARRSCSARPSRKRRSFRDRRCNNARRPGDSRRPPRTRRLPAPLRCRPHCLQLPRSRSRLRPPSRSLLFHRPRGSTLRLLPSHRAPLRRGNRGGRYRPLRRQRGT